ncbi:MAG: DDE-type integrase/transposase/recombinase [Christensenellaceae bacterium]|jgi:transposase InsO family protein|nr:DDE-type integrase/transposase/recombinase [Christensenellaceae bacterium]
MPSSKDEEIQLYRYKLISPMLDSRLDDKEILRIRRLIAEEYKISEKTLSRLLAKFKQGSFKGLLPLRGGRPTSCSIPESVLNEAIRMRKEQPERSVKDIILYLEMHQYIEEGSVKRSTLQYQLEKAKFGKRHMDHYLASDNSGGMRFQRVHRNELWQADGKEGILINNKKTHLISFIDDATRLIIHSEYYFAESTDAIVDCFIKGISKCGIPESVYFDRGRAFQSIRLERACGILEIQKRSTQPYSPYSKGKIERSFQFADKFKNELLLEPVSTLADLNATWQPFVDVFYQNSPHSALKNGMTPREAYDADDNPLKFVTQERLDEAFMNIYRGRVIDKSGCVNFKGQKYTAEGMMNFICKKVDIVWNSLEPIKVWVLIDDNLKFEVKPLVIKTWVPSSTKQNKQSVFVVENRGSLAIQAAKKEAEKLNNQRADGLLGNDWKETEATNLSVNELASVTSKQETADDKSKTNTKDKNDLDIALKVNGISFQEMKTKEEVKTQLDTMKKKGISFVSMKNKNNTITNDEGDD